ncbi:MAG TPA: flagellin, partial [Candidatus Wallbacteria bacterium]|nr:flagellin [Candidatus Wallbacteria bacterium]
MFIFINTNIASINANRHLCQTGLDLDRSLERLSSGLRINSAADDASGLDIAE